MSAGIEDEPALAGASRAADAGADAIGGEAALAGVPEAVCDKALGDARMREMWESPASAGGAARLLALCAASGAFAVLCAFAKGALGFGILAVAVGAPVVEEFAKVVLPMMWLEKAPWRFRSAAAIMAACLASALAFATIENLLYIHVYIPEERLDDAIVNYRLVVCTALHVCCTAISATGLARAWRAARGGRCGFSAAAVTPFLVVAMVVHGLYNAIVSIVGMAAPAT